MKENTHLQINKDLCGTPIKIEEGYCLVRLKATESMKVDNRGLIHGGFIFGVADYAAMLAVNHPNVVLGSAEVYEDGSAFFEVPARTPVYFQALAGSRGTH